MDEKGGEPGESAARRPGGDWPDAAGWGALATTDRNEKQDSILRFPYLGYGTE